MNRIENRKRSSCSPVLEFISGKTETAAAKRVTKGINSLQSLWLLAKMTGNVRNAEKK